MKTLVIKTATELKDVIDKGITATHLCIKATVGEIPNNAFLNNNTLVKVVLEEGITTIGVAAFCNCRLLEEIFLPDSITKIGSDALSGTALTTLILPAGLEVLEPYTLYGCENLKHLYLPSKLRSIEHWALAKTGLKTVILPNSVREIHESSHEGTGKNDIYVYGHFKPIIIYHEINEGDM